MTGRVTMLGISRWTGRRGSYRTVQRFFNTVIPWGQVFCLFFRTHLFQPDSVYLMAGDEYVVTKSGKHTHGLDRFFSSLYEKALPGVAFFALSLVSTKQRRSYPMRVEQVIRTESEKAEIQARKKQRHKKRKPGSSKRKPGRPKGSKNKNKTEVTLSEELKRIQVMVKQLQSLVGKFLPLIYLLLDGHFGNNNALQMVRQCGVHLISKLRFDAALYFRYNGPYKGQGPHQVYGQKFNPHNIRAKFLKSVSIEKGFTTGHFLRI